MVFLFLFFCCSFCYLKKIIRQGKRKKKKEKRKKKKEKRKKKKEKKKKEKREKKEAKTHSQKRQHSLCFNWICFWKHCSNAPFGFFSTRRSFLGNFCLLFAFLVSCGFWWLFYFRFILFYYFFFFWLFKVEKRKKKREQYIPILPKLFCES